MNEWSANKQDRVLEVWNSLCEMFGSKFISNYGEKPSQMWVASINGFKDYEIQRGLRKLLYKGSGTPPTLPQFIAACKYFEEDDEQPVQSTTALPPSPYNEPIWCHGQKTMLAYLWNNKVNDDQLPAMISVKNKLVEDFRRIFAEDENLTGKEIKDTMFAAWDKIIYPHGKFA